LNNLLDVSSTLQGKIMKHFIATVAAAFMGFVVTPAHAVPSVYFLIDGNTFVQPFQISNDSSAGERITRFQLDLGPTNTCFDPVSLSGDNVSPCQDIYNYGVAFTPRDGTDIDTGLIPPVPLPDGAILLDIRFSGFDIGEKFRWDIDIDHRDCSSTNDVLACNPVLGGLSTVTGNQLIGALATVDFSDGQRLLGVLGAVAGNDDASQFTLTGVTVTPVPEPTSAGLAVIGLLALARSRRSRHPHKG
jgi:MYXO-CTERM domain-containing protein